MLLGRWTTGTNDQVVGPDVNLPGTEQLAPILFGFLAAGLFFVLILGIVIRVVRTRRAADGEGPGFPWILLSVTSLLVLSLLGTWWYFPPKFTTPEFPPIGRIFPEETFFYRDATDLPVSADSDRWIASLDSGEFVAGFGGQPYGGVVFGVPFNLVESDTPMENVRVRHWPELSYTGRYPITDPAYIESMPNHGIDNHYVALDRGASKMWELIGVVVWFGTWEADAGALWDLDSTAYSGGGTTAPGLPLLPGLIGYDEVAAGGINHVMLGTAPPAQISTTNPIWPAIGTDGTSEQADAIPMGAWMRLRSDVDLSGLGPQARVIAEGLQRYGMIMSDSSRNFAVRGTPDARFDTDDLRTMRTLDADDFEIVDASGIMVAPDSMAAIPPGG